MEGNLTIFVAVQYTSYDLSNILCFQFHSKFKYKREESMIIFSVQY